MTVAGTVIGGVILAVVLGSAIALARWAHKPLPYVPYLLLAFACYYMSWLMHCSWSAERKGGWLRRLLSRLGSAC